MCASTDQGTLPPGLRSAKSLDLMSDAVSPAAGTGGRGQRTSAKFRRSVSPFGEPPSAAEMRSQDQSAARASRTAIRRAFCATRRVSTAALMSSSRDVVMTRIVPWTVALFEESDALALPIRLHSVLRLD